MMLGNFLGFWESGNVRTRKKDVYNMDTVNIYIYSIVIIIS